MAIQKHVLNSDYVATNEMVEVIFNGIKVDDYVGVVGVQLFKDAFRYKKNGENIKTITHLIAGFLRSSSPKAHLETRICLQIIY